MTRENLENEAWVAPPTMTWSDYTLSNPIEDIEAFRRRVQSAIGYAPPSTLSLEDTRQRIDAFLRAAEDAERESYIIDESIP